MMEKKYLVFSLLTLHLNQIVADPVTTHSAVELSSRAKNKINEVVSPKYNCEEPKNELSKYCYESKNGSRIIDFTKIVSAKTSDKKVLIENSGKVFLEDSNGELIIEVPIHMVINSLQEKTLNSTKKNRLSLLFPTVLDSSQNPLEITFLFRVNALCTIADENSSDRTLCGTNNSSGLILNFLNVKKDEKLLLNSLIKKAGLRGGLISRLFTSDTFNLQSEAMWDEFGNKMGPRNSLNGYYLKWDLSQSSLFLSDFAYCSDVLGQQTFFSKIK